ncbi:MAG TPA: endonuclease VIII [Clostridia bacterium]|nr:endonuclease VIII [Clostridia bacterium]
MIELPEAYVLAEQINNTLVNKTIISACANAHPHTFAWFTGDPKEYNDKLFGRKITSANPGTQYTCVGNTEIICTDPAGDKTDMLLTISTPIRYHAVGEKLPKHHQLLLEFEDHSHLSCTVQMWGSMFCYLASENGLPDGYTCNKAPSALSNTFDESYFNMLLAGVKPSLSVKAFLATEQRIPGLGNGVLQDILFYAGINPKTKLEKLSDDIKERLYKSVKTTLADMVRRGGRDTEKDLFGHEGGYKTVLSKKTVHSPCPICDATIVREVYLGGNIYYCPICQAYEK